ncbi:hypothetical protein [Vibrio ulleungensis]|uniref:Cardiolipin synthase N-terminal domain-containing protein n=1 Tax=Vibrio ulleungensis TaxID=2807619 RepID=A0ABS2HJ72_9VIBR|nr:hypothetical protein [Vibrio ulleungensis]MBM7036562.1 hypothetical protein [Vibrio ulleungensis]
MIKFLRVSVWGLIVVFFIANAIYYLSPGLGENEVVSMLLLVAMVVFVVMLIILPVLIAVKDKGLKSRSLIILMSVFIPVLGGYISYFLLKKQ